jgi:hypothetical protein
VEHVEQKVDALAVTVDALAVSVDERFDAAFIQQRELAVLVMDTLRGEMNARSAHVDSRFDRLERKLDQFIDVQLQNNALTDRRLARLESARP